MAKSSVYKYFIIIAILFFFLNFFVLNIVNRLAVMGLFLVLLSITFFLFNYQKDNFDSKKSLMITMGLFALAQITLYYLTGFIDGFANNAIKINIKTILTIIIPIMVSISSIEIIRYLVSQKFEKDKTFEIFTIILFVLMDILLFHPTPNLLNLDSLLEFIGITMFPSIVYNSVFNKLTIKYGYKPILVYRIIIVLSYYILPVIPNTYVLFRSIGRIIIPLLIYLIISYMYDRIEFEEVFVRKKRLNVVSIIMIFLTLIFAGLVSCKFQYGLLTVGSSSMNKTIKTGDIVIFEKYNNQDLNIGDIIIFKMGKRSIIHRIVEIGILNNDYIFITKGDSNKNRDSSYRNKDDILGVVHKKIKYLGYPSIWIRDLFN